MSHSLTKRIPAAQQAQVWIDFDGTISTKDVLDEMIQQFAVDESWLQIEQLWQEGKIGSYECLKGEFGVVRVQDFELGAFLRTIDIDPGTIELIKLLQQHQVPVTIVSDGVDLFINTVLGRHGLSDLAIRSNTIVHSGDRLTLQCPHRASDCRSDAAHCKCQSMLNLAKPGRKGIYIGDGRSDLCPSSRPELSEVVFAKKALARELTARGLDFIPYVTLHDVSRMLKKAWVAHESTVL